MKAFKDLQIDNDILKVINEEKSKFKQPTLIQKKAIPLTLENKNIIGTAPTGSGKTLAFAVQTIQNITIKQKDMQALIITPTRELCDQVTQEIRKFAKYKDINISLIRSGISMNNQIEELKTAQIAIGTPGRILDHLNKKTLNLTNLKTLILDEADILIQNEFVEQISNIIDNTPKDKQTMLFSATITPEVAKLANKYIESPIKVFAGNTINSKQLNQFYYETPVNMKLTLLMHLIKNEKAGLSIVFSNRQETTEFIAKNIKTLGLKVESIHGATTKGRRNRTIKDFQNNKFDVLVCTDLAARGLDVDHVSHIYNYNIPIDENKYTHRIGRTARANQSGKVINLVTPKDAKNFILIVKKNRLEIIRRDMPKLEAIGLKSVQRKQGYKKANKQSENKQNNNKQNNNAYSKNDN